MAERQRPRAYWDEDEPLITGQTVIESEPEHSGLLDAQGRPLVRVRQPIGFKLGGPHGR